MARKKSPPKRDASGRSISGMLREFITARDLTDYQLGQLAGVDPGAIGRFMRRERDLSGPSIDRLGEALGLALVERSARGRGRPPARGREGPTAPAGGDGPSVLGLDRGEASATRHAEAGSVDRHSVPAEGSGGHQADEG